MALEKWEKIHQPYEFNYWKEKGIFDYSNEEYFVEYWMNIWKWINVIPGREVLDIGSGPRPVMKEGYVIEPLGKRYIEIAKKSWWENIILYAKPAEEFIQELQNKFNFILCWNSIDHSYDPLKVLENINRYLKEGGILVLATDLS